LIWDNIHANDYDPRRIFLGPYDGRSPEIIPYLRGVLTNPNTEFESNYVALHSLGQWCIPLCTCSNKLIITNCANRLIYLSEKIGQVYPVFEQLNIWAIG
jgi:hypothetical protein